MAKEQLSNKTGWGQGGEGRNPLMVQWLGLWAFTAEGEGSIPGQEIKIPQAARHSPKIHNKTGWEGRGLHFYHPSNRPIMRYIVMLFITYKAVLPSRESSISRENTALSVFYGWYESPYQMRWAHHWCLAWVPECLMMKARSFHKIF